jgi:hypothetical protein
LVANGSVGGTVTMADQGTLLTGSGSIGGLASTGGTINPGLIGSGAGATLTVNGNVSFNSGSLSHLVIDMVGVTTTNGGMPAYDTVVATGTVTGLNNLAVYIAGMPEVPSVNFQPGKFAAGFDVLHSTGNLTGTTFNAANFDTDYTWWKATPSISADGHDVIVTVTWAAIPGDVSGPSGKPDGVVNGYDYGTLTANWFTTSGLTWLTGDVSGPTGDPDGKVDGYDYGTLTANWFHAPISPPSSDGWVPPTDTGDDAVVVPPSSGMVSVPEPATVTLLVLGGIALIRRRR